MAEFETVDYSKLQTLNLALTNFFAHSLPNGKLYKNSISELATFIAPFVSSAGASGYVEVNSNSLPTPTGLSYSIVGTGTYTHSAGNVNATGDLNIISFNAGVWSLLKPIDIDLINYVKKTQLLNSEIKNSASTFLVKEGEEENPFVVEFTKITRNIYLMAPAGVDYSVSFFGVNNVGVFNSIIGLQILRQDGESTNYRINKPMKAGNIYEMFAEAGSTLTGQVRVFYMPDIDVDTTTPQYFSYIGDTTILTLTETAYNVPFLNKTYQFGLYENALKESVYRTIKNLYLYKKGILLNPNDFAITYVGFNTQGSATLIQLSRADGTSPSNYRTNATSGTVKMQGFDALSVEGIEIYLEYEYGAVIPASILANFTPPQLKFTEKGVTNIDFIKGLASGVQSVNGRVYIDVTSAGGPNAIQNAVNSITDASALRPYTVRAAAGVYKITNSSQFITGLPGSPAMIMTKDYVDVEGQSKEDVIVWAELPYNDADIDTAEPRNNHQTVWNYSDKSTIKNITFFAKNMRYVVHQDVGLEADKSRGYEDCDFIFIGNKGSLRAFGIGTHSGSKTYVTGGRSISGQSAPFAIHNSVNAAKKSLWQFKDHEFISKSQNTVMLIQNSGSLVGDDLIFNGCSYGAGSKVEYLDWWIYIPNVNDSYNGAEWKIKGSGNAPFYLENSTKQISLAFKSATTGLTSKIAFYESSSAFPVLIKNPRNYFGFTGSPDRYVKNGAIYFDGAVGLSGYAIGCKSIREIPYLFGTNVSEDTIGKRLGNCSTVNKTLGVYVDGVLINIVFNQNYTARTNASIISDINATLAGSAIAYEHNVGMEYATELTDVISVCSNGSSTTPILKGTIVNFINGLVVPAVDFSKPIGVAIDDLAPHRSGSEGEVYGNGRIARNCFLSLDQGTYLRVNKSTDAAKYTVSNGQLVPDANGNIINQNGFVLIP